MRTVNVDAGVRDVLINEAMDIARTRGAFELGTAPEDLVIVSWYDCRADKHSPNLISGWEDYGKSHGATLRLEINDGEFVFLCEDAGIH
jgi:hypothetical protein